MKDVVIIGGGPAGLSGALVLARSHRAVTIVDHGIYRNRNAEKMHGFLSRDGESPTEFLKIARDQVLKYPNVTLLRDEAISITSMDGGFAVSTKSNQILRSRKILLATGVKDRLPPLQNIDELFGVSVFHCPYCDGWEVSKKRVAVYGTESSIVDFSLVLTNWCPDLILFTDGKVSLSPEQHLLLERRNITLNEREVKGLRRNHRSNAASTLAAVELRNGSEVPCEALFVQTHPEPISDLIRGFGCKFDEEQNIEVNDFECTNVPGLYAAGDNSKNLQMVILAAAEGAQAAYGINSALHKEDLEALRTQLGHSTDDAVYATQRRTDNRPGEFSS